MKSREYIDLMNCFSGLCCFQLETGFHSFHLGRHFSLDFGDWRVRNQTLKLVSSDGRKGRRKLESYIIIVGLGRVARNFNCHFLLAFTICLSLKNMLFIWIRIKTKNMPVSP